MKFTDIHLQTSHSLDAMATFYEKKLQLPVQRTANGDITVTTGATRIHFGPATTDHAPIYHIAMNIVPSQFDEALAWTRTRFDLLRYNGKDVVDFSQSHWQALSLYFEDPAGNVLEFIARERVNVQGDAPPAFGPRSILRVSEIGMATDDVPRLAGQITSQLGVPVFDTGDENFKALGDDDGLLILVKTGRNWMPTDNRPAGLSPVTLTAAGNEPSVLSIPELPYTIRVTNE